MINDPMKKSSIYSIFGKYYGNKLYKLLDECCDGNGNFCYEVKECLGVSDTGDPSLVLNQQGNWITVSSVATLIAQNGLTESVPGTIELGGLLIKNTNINQNGFLYTITDTYASYISGPNPLGVTTNWIQKEISPTEYTVAGLIDLSSFGLDLDTVFLGRVNFLGAPATQIFIQPTSGNIVINTTNDFSITAGQNWFGGVNDGGSGAGHYKVDFTMHPYDTTPAIVWEIKNEQNYALGYAALDTPTKKYSNIYYGTLDSSNIITDISRVEATDLGTSSIFNYNLPSGFWNEFLITSTEVEIRNSEFNSSFKMENSGEIVINKYPNSRNDSGTKPPVNFLYTDSSGKLLSTTLSQIMAGEIKDSQTGITGTTLTLPSTPIATTLKVFKNGQLLDEGVTNDYTLSGNVLTFTISLVSSDKIKSFYFV